MEPTNPLLDDYVLSLASAKEPRILFLPTASGDTTAQINAFHARFADRLCIPEHLSLFRLGEVKRPLAEIVLEQDIVYVGGGSMRNLLAIWRAHGLDKLLEQAWRAGVVLAGLSAGAMCWFEGGITRSSGPPAPMAGLGLLRGIADRPRRRRARAPARVALERARRHPPRRLGGRRRRRACCSRDSACSASSAHGRAPARSASTRSPASSSGTASRPSCSASTPPERSAATTRTSRNCGASTACGAACSAKGFRSGGSGKPGERASRTSEQAGGGK